ncbi:MAG: M23 family metallopeptidase, partial [Bacteroidetes bacterium]|nr:M23 family metallopeptidase [Bacteroidota bacterium]
SWLVLIVILSITPLKDFLFVINNSELKAQTEKIQQLQERVLVLSEQLQTLASTNERMKYAMKLAKKDSIKPNDPLYDTLRKPINKNLKIGGNIYAAFVSLWKKLFSQPDVTNRVSFIEPANGIITQEFNPSIGHMGVDYGIKTGSPIYAAGGGLVIFSDYTTDNGYVLIMQHDDGFITIYQHCSALLKKVRDYVSQGELIALSGNTGTNSTGPHLHFEIWQNGKPIDPKTVLINK